MKQTVTSWVAALAVILVAFPASPANVVSDAQTLGVNAASNLRIPDARTFTVAAAGQVQVTLRDLGTPTGGATGFTKLKAIVTQGGTKVASLAAAGTLQFPATPGLYKVQVVGTAVAPAGSFDVVVQTAPGGVSLLQFSDGIEAVPVAPNPAQSTLDVTFPIATAGSYQVTLTDRALPSALSSVDVVLLRQGAIPITLTGPCTSPCSTNFNVSSAGSYNLLVIARAADPGQAGVYSVAVTGGSGATTVYSSTQPVGRMPAPQSLTLSAGSGTLQLADFSTPAALTSLSALVTQGATSLGSQTGAGTATLSPAAAGAASVFVFSRPGTGGAGSYGLTVSQPGGVVLRDARAIPDGFDATANIGGYRHVFNVSTAGAYRAQLRDLAFPGAFSSLRGILVQNGAIVQALASGTLATPNLGAGSATALVFGTPATAGTNSLYGISVAPSTGTAALDQAQGVGPLIATRNFDIPAAGSHDLTVDDLQFPDPFAELAVAVTEGSTLVGQIFGGGKITFTAAAGPHAVSLLPRPASAAEYATWGFDVSTTPPAPTLTLTSSTANVVSGNTVALTWSTTNATTCTATGGWTGTKALSGTETSAALQGNTTFTLACAGLGGSVIKSVAVSTSAEQPSGGSGGGGSMDGALLGLIVMAGAATLYRRRRVLDR